MINQCLSYLFQASVGVTVGFAMESMQKAKQNNIKKWMRIVCWILWYAGVGIAKFITNMSTVGFFIGLIIVFGGLLLNGYLFYEGRFWNRFMIGFVIIAASITAEFSYFPMVWLFQTDSISLDFRQTDMMVGSLIGNFFSNISIYLVVVLWRKFGLKKRMPKGSVVFLLMSLCMMIPPLFAFHELVKRGGSASLLHMIPMVGAFVIDLLLIYILFNQAEKDELEKELSELKYQTELERQHYEDLEVRREEMAKIRHDYNNLLSAVLGLLHMKKEEEAEKMVESLLEKVKQTESDSDGREA